MSNNTDTPLALRLADALETEATVDTFLDRAGTCRKAAAELRRLHDENEALRHDLKTEAALLRKLEGTKHDHRRNHDAG